MQCRTLLVLLFVDLEGERGEWVTTGHVMFAVCLDPERQLGNNRETKLTSGDAMRAGRQTDPP